VRRLNEITLVRRSSVGREEIRARASGRRTCGDYFVQTTHPGTIQLDDDTASGHAAVINNDDELECGLYRLEPAREVERQRATGSDQLAG
jgi:hypothetical protein